MKKFIAPILFAAAVSAQAAPTTLTAYGTHVLLGPSADNTLSDWSLTLTYDSSAVGETIPVVVSAVLYQDSVNGVATYSYANPFGGGIPLTLPGEPQPVGDFSWNFETVGNTPPTSASDIVGIPYIYSYSRGLYAEYIPDGISVVTSPVPEPATFGLLLSGLTCLGGISYARRRRTSSDESMASAATAS